MAMDAAARPPLTKLAPLAAAPRMASRPAAEAAIIDP
jgi:hypothetical protein